MKKTTLFDELKLVRPWLNIPRSILDGVINEMELNYRYDSSNSSTHFERNWIRHNLITLINEHFKSDIKDRLIRTSLISAESYDFISQYSKKIFEEHKKHSLLGILFPLDIFKKLHPAVQSAVLMLMIDVNSSQPTQFSYNSLIKLKNFALNDSLHCPLQLPGKISIGKAYNHLFVGIKKDFNIKNTKIKIGNYITTESGLTISIEPVEHRGKSISSNGEVWKKIALGLDAEMIQFASVPKNSTLSVRSRRGGDRYTPIHGNKSKIKDLFITAHIPQQLKNVIPIVEFDKKVVWLSGWRIADEFKIPDNITISNNQNIALKIRYKPENHCISQAI